MDPRNNEYYKDWILTLEDDIKLESADKIWRRIWEALETDGEEEMMYGLASSEVIAAALGKPDVKLSKSIAEWAARTSNHLEDQLVRNAYNFLVGCQSGGGEYERDLKARLY